MNKRIYLILLVVVLAVASSVPAYEGMAINTMSSLLISHLEQSVFGSLRSILAVVSLHSLLIMRATFSVPPVGLKMISIVFICFSSRYSILWRMPAMQSASVLSASARTNAPSISANSSLSTGRMCRPTTHWSLEFWCTSNR